MTKDKIRLFLIITGLTLSVTANAQLMNHYWALNFNSQSSLLSGAVVAGDGGNASIYYNPSTISEIKTGSNLSFAASLLTWGVYYFNNALGNGIDIYNVSFNVQPQFMSYSYRPKNSKFSFAFSAITRLKEQFDINYYDSQMIDVISSTPGKENYNVVYKYFLNDNDNWFGVASAYDVSDKFKIGGSLFLSVNYISYRYNISTSAYSPYDTIWVDGVPRPTLVTESYYNENLRFLNYRFIGKIGFSYVLDRWRFGLNITTGSFSVYSSKKEAHRNYSISNVTDPDNGNFMPGFEINQGLMGSDLKTNSKYPFSAAFGLIYNSKIKPENKFYFTVEFFSGIKPYKIVNAPINDKITSEIIYNDMENKDWLSFVSAARPVINFAIGYRWQIRDQLMFLSGFRTDFNSQHNADYKEFSDYNKIKCADLDIYHYTGGFQFTLFKKYLLVAGGEISFGYENNLEQIANFDNPVEYNSDTGQVLQGSLEDDMNIFFFGFNIYISTTFRFGHNN